MRYRNTKAIGDVSQVMIMAALVRAGATVLTPYGDNCRYDLALERDGKLLRIQCKTAWVPKRAGTVEFLCCSSYVHRGGGKKNYRGGADLFGVYSPDLDKICFVPVDIAPTSSVLA